MVDPPVLQKIFVPARVAPLLTPWRDLFTSLGRAFIILLEPGMH
jgi:hypothetical protein